MSFSLKEKQSHPDWLGLLFSGFLTNALYSKGQTSNGTSRPGAKSHSSLFCSAHGWLPKLAPSPCIWHPNSSQCRGDVAKSWHQLSAQIEGKSTVTSEMCWWVLALYPSPACNSHAREWVFVFQQGPYSFAAAIVSQSWFWRGNREAVLLSSTNPIVNSCSSCKRYLSSLHTLVRQKQAEI